MRIVGQDELVRFVRQDATPNEAEVIRAWLSELRYRNWPEHTSLAADFRSLDVSRLPMITFWLISAGVCVETLVDFRTGVMLVTGIRRELLQASSPAYRERTK